LAISHTASDISHTATGIAPNAAYGDVCSYRPKSTAIDDARTIGPPTRPTKVIQSGASEPFRTTKARTNVLMPMINPGPSRNVASWVAT